MLKSLGLAVGVGLLCFAFAGAMFARHLHFSPHYHPDEWSKAEQVATGDYNFYHPQLLLRSTQAVLLLRGASANGQVKAEEPQEPHWSRIVYAGRLASSGMMALGVGVLSGLACWQVLAGRSRARAVEVAIEPMPRGARAAGAIGAGLMVGSLLATTPLVVQQARYMKEDSALVLTLAIWLATMAIAVRRAKVGPVGWKLAAAVGVAAGLTLCGKWLGGVMAGASLVWIMWQPRRWSMLASFLAGAVAIWLLVNLPVVWNLGRFTSGIAYEAGHVTSSHHGIVSTGQTWFFAREIWTQLNAIVLFSTIEIGAAMAWWIATRRTTVDRRLEASRPRSVGDVALCLLLIGVFFTLISQSSVAAPRYVLPIVVPLVYLAAVGVARFAMFIASPRSREGELKFPGRSPAVRVAIVAGIVLFVIAGEAGMNFKDKVRSLDAAMAHDSRDALRRWLADNLPSDSHVLADQSAGLLAWEVPGELTNVQTAASVDPASMGATHVVITSITWNDYFSDHRKPTAAFAKEFEVRRARYTSWRNAPAVFELAPDTTIARFNDPTIRVIALPVETAAP